MVRGSKKWVLYPPHITPPGRLSGGCKGASAALGSWLLLFSERCLVRYSGAACVGQSLTVAPLPKPSPQRPKLAHPAAGVRPSEDGADVASPVSLVEWFMSFYDHKNSVGCAPLECILKAGEMLFVPVSRCPLCSALCVAAAAAAALSNGDIHGQA